jgi:hypothetical protein
MSRGGIHKRINPPIEGPPAVTDAYARERAMRSDDTSHLCAAGCHRPRMEPGRYCSKCWNDLHGDRHGE